MTRLTASEEVLPNLGIGLGLRSEIAEETFSHLDAIDWLEFTPENYMRYGGSNYKYLEFAASKVPLVSHSVCLSAGGADEIDWKFLKEMKAILDDLNVAWFSDHICYTSASGIHVDDLLPLPSTQSAARHLAERIKRIRDFIGRPMLIENISYYTQLPGAQISEAEFITQVLEEADCGLLLDVNNVYVNAMNHRFDAKKFLDSIPLHRVAQIHIAGHTVTDFQLIDTHGESIPEPVFELLDYVLNRVHVKAIMVERDQNFDNFNEILGEVETVRKIQKASAAFDNAAIKCLSAQSLKKDQVESGNSTAAEARSFVSDSDREVMDAFCTYILSGNATERHSQYKPIDDHLFRAFDERQVHTYIHALQLKMAESLRRVYPACAHYLSENWNQIASDYLRLYPTTSYSVSAGCGKFPNYLAGPCAAELLTDKPFLHDLADFEWHTRGPIEEGNVVATTPCVEFDSVEKLQNWGPILNPTLQIKTFRHPVISIANNLPTLDQISSLHQDNCVAFCRVPDKRHVQALSLTPAAERLVNAARSSGQSYADLLRTGAETSSEDPDAEDVAILLRLIAVLRANSIFIGSIAVAC